MNDIQIYYDMVDDPPCVYLTPWEMFQHMNLILITQLIIRDYAFKNKWTEQQRIELTNNVIPESRIALMNYIHHGAHMNILLNDMYKAYISRLHRF